MDFFSMSNNNMTESMAASFLDFHTAGWIFSLLVVLPENVYVIWLIVNGAGNGLALEIFSLNLYICETVICFQSFLCLVCNGSQECWFLVSFLNGFSTFGRPVFQCLICVERYLAVVHPVTFLKSKPLRYRLICCTAAWIFILMSCVFSTCAMMQFQMYTYICFCMCQALMTLSMKLFCCLAVLRALKKSGPGEGKRDEENLMKRRAFKVIVLIIMSMLLIYGLYLVTGLSYVLTHELILSLWSAGQLCFLLGGLVQPLLFLHRIGKRPFCNTM